MTLAAAGCGSEPGLANQDKKALYVRQIAAGTQASDTNQIDVTIGSSEINGHCPIAKPDLQGTVNGVPMTVTFLGEDDDDWDPGCKGPELVAPFPGSGPLDIRVWDSTGEIRATFATSFEQRTLELVEPSDGKLYIGDRVVLRHSPASDVMTKTEGDGISVYSGYWHAPVQRDGGLFSFVVPEVSLNVGETSLALGVQVEALNTSCVGAKTCTLQVSAGLHGNIPVTVVQDERGAAACYECACKFADLSVINQWSSPVDAPFGPPFHPLRCSTVQCGDGPPHGAAISATCVARTAEEVVPR